MTAAFIASKSSGGASECGDRAVVRSEEEEGVVRDSGFIECLHHLAESGVQLGNVAHVFAVFVAGVEFGKLGVGCNGRMRFVDPYGKGEGLLGVVDLLQPVDRFGGDDLS